MSYILDTVLSLFKVWKYSFVLPIYDFNNQNFCYRPCVERYFYSFILVISFFSIFLYPILDNEISITKIMYNFDIMALNFNLMLVILTVHRKFEKFIEILERILEIDNAVKSFGITLSKFLKKRHIYIFSVYLLIYLAMASIELYSVHEETFQFIQIAVYYVCYLIILSVQLFYIILHFFLKRCIETSRYFFINDTEFQIEHKTALLRKIIFAVSKLNSLFSMPILFEFFYDFSMILSTSFWGVILVEMSLGAVIILMWFLCTCFKYANIISAAATVEKEVSIRF